MGGDAAAGGSGAEVCAWGWGWGVGWRLGVRRMQDARMHQPRCTYFVRRPSYMLLWMRKRVWDRPSGSLSTLSV